MPAPVYSSPKLAAALRKCCPKEDVKTIQVKHLYTREVTAFIRRIEKAHKTAAKSKLVFK